ncbi:MAG: DUF4190 domain-containing protein, partial [Candidatus Phosphoribacter baldrii]
PWGNTPAPPPAPPAAAPGYSQPPYGQAGYGAQQGYGQPAPYAQQPPYAAPPAYGGAVYSGLEHPQGTLILILGILSIVLCGLPTGLFAWVMGRKALREIDASGQLYSNRGMVQAGMITGIIGTVGLILWVLYIAFVIIMVVAAGSGSIR